MHDVSDKQLVRIDWRPSTASLRSFAAAMLLVLAVGALRHRAQDTLLRDPLALTLAGLALITAALAAVRPAWLRPAYIALGVATYPVRWLVALLSLAFLYYAVITPIALGLRVMRKHRAGSADSSGSAWVVSHARADKSRYFRQF